MAVNTEDKPNRLQRVTDAHPWIRENEVRLLLIHEYKKLYEDPTVKSSSDYELRLESFTDILTRMTEHDIRNRMAVVAEQLVDPWEEVISQMAETDD